MGKRLFLVEDDENFGSVLCSYLEMNGFSVKWVKDGLQAQNEFAPGEFDICVFDVMLPKVDGFSLAIEFRSKHQEMPFIFLTARKLREDIIKGYKLGADDYITKPFDSEILLFKLNAILGRSITKNSFSDTGEFKFGKSRFNYKLRMLFLPEKDVHLSPKEADLLKMLCERLNDILHRDDALVSIWGTSDYFTTRSMDVYVAKLRKLLSADNTIQIVSVHGSGIRLIESK